MLLPGSDLVDWLYTHVSGFVDRRDARRYACNLLKAGFIQHTVNKVTFSEQCYYVFLNSLATGTDFTASFVCVCGFGLEMLSHLDILTINMDNS